MVFETYYKQIANLLLSQVELVFEFKNNLSGINYYRNKNGQLIKYLQSSNIVRDRELLKDNNIWLKLKDDFNKKIIVGYKNLWFYCHESVWSPSIDAVFLIDVLLKDENIQNSKIKSVLDFGCGTGVIGIFLANINPKIEDLHFIDSNNYALFSTLINIIGNKVNCNYNISNSLKENHKFDIGIVTPYYFPVIKKIISDPQKAILTAGEESANLTNIIANKSNTTYFIYSSTTEKSYIKNLKYDFEKVKELLVPFTLGDNVSHEIFLNAALKNNLLQINEKSQFKYWHKITIGKIKN